MRLWTLVPFTFGPWTINIGELYPLNHSRMVLGPTPIWNLECTIQWAENSVKVHRAAQVSGPEFSMSSTLIECCFNNRNVKLKTVTFTYLAFQKKKINCYVFSLCFRRRFCDKCRASCFWLLLFSVFWAWNTTKNGRCSQRIKLSKKKVEEKLRSWWNFSENY